MLEESPKQEDKAEELGPISDYYRILGLPVGASGTDIWLSWEKLRMRADPARFAPGSTEHQAAIMIRARVDEAYAILNQVVGRGGSEKLRDPAAVILLRPSVSPPTSPTELLRPKEKLSCSDPDELLRPNCESHVPDENPVD